ncbi:MAG: hypothetical protein ACRD3Q_18280 [Terriglobales bacterium]
MSDSDNAGIQPTGFQPSDLPQLQRGYQPIGIDEFERHQHATTGTRLAGWLLVILAVGIALHYTCLMILILFKREDAVKILEDVLHSWLPVVSGLAGGAVTYYFTKQAARNR